MRNRALLVIDVQDSFPQQELWEQTLYPDIAERVDRLVDLARADGDLVVWVLHTEPGSGGAFDPSSGHVRYLEGVSGPRPGDVEVSKTSHNVFTTTNLQQLLSEHGVTEIVVCGIRAEQCVETSARIGSDLGYRVVYVADAVTTEPLGGLSAGEVVKRTELVLRGRFAEIATIADLESVAASPA